MHYGRCIPEPERTKESETEVCDHCGKSINSYYRSFHYPRCAKQLIKKVKVLKQAVEQPVRHINELRIIKENGVNYTRELSDYLRNKAVLEGEYWVLYRNGKRIGIVEKATKEELTSWDPRTETETDEKH